MHWSPGSCKCGTPASSGLLLGHEQHMDPSLRMVPTHLCNSSLLLPSSTIHHKLDPSWSPLGLCLIRNAFSSPGKPYSPARQSLFDPSLIIPPPCSLYNTCSSPPFQYLLQCSLPRCLRVCLPCQTVSPLGPGQWLIQCASPSVSAGPGTAKMPSQHGGFITNGQEGPHTGHRQG